VGGQATDFEIHARDLIATRCALAGKYEETINKPIDFLKDIEWIDMTAQQALDYWIVDTIIKKYNRVVTPDSTSL